ncbi:MAG: amidohydrolase [Hyphomicrobiales bacterium]|nr:amidohydrolase [Hyphomicrobiales bacterium]
MSFREALGAVWLGLALLLARPAASADIADLLIVNAKIVTLDRNLTAARSMSVRGDRILGVYDASAPQTIVGPTTRIIDAGGRTIVPGLIDSHIHAIRAGLTFDEDVSFEGARTISEAMARLAFAASATDPDRWIVVAGGWTPQQFAEARRPTREEIEAAAPGRRVYLQLFYRAVFLSEAAQSELGIDLENPPDGTQFERNAAGDPSGWLTGDVDSVAALWERLPKSSIDTRKSGTRAFFAKLNSYGITGVIDPGGHNLAPVDYRVVSDLASADLLSLRVDYFVSAPRRGTELAFFQDVVARQPIGSGHRFLRFRGIGERVTFGMYNNDTPDSADIAAFEAVARWALAAGIPMTVHWNNQASAHHLLGALARVGDTTERRRLRWSIAHLHDADARLIVELQEVGLGWLTQNALYFAAPAFLRAMSSARREVAPPLRSALRAGLKVAAGTDATRVMSANPFVAMQWMLDGRTVDGQQTRTAAELPSRDEVLRLWTEGPAYFAFAETERGRIASGMLADFAVLDADLMSIPVERIGSIKSVLTVVGGRVVHTSPD